MNAKTTSSKPRIRGFQRTARNHPGHPRSFASSRVSARAPLAPRARRETQAMRRILGHKERGCYRQLRLLLQNQRIRRHLAQKRWMGPKPSSRQATDSTLAKALRLQPRSPRVWPWAMEPCPVRPIRLQPLVSEAVRRRAPQHEFRLTRQRMLPRTQTERSKQATAVPPSSQARVQAIAADLSLDESPSTPTSVNSMALRAGRT